jgi:hypothetical protein
MMFEDPRNALSIARTHQEGLVQQEQRDRLGRQAQAAQRQAKRAERSPWWWLLRFVGGWRKARVSSPAAD